jgi:hypothetical protein
VEIVESGLRFVLHTPPDNQAPRNLPPAPSRAEGVKHSTVPEKYKKLAKKF